MNGQDLPNRLLTIRLACKENRDFLLTAVRTMISDLHVNTPAMRILLDTASGVPVTPIGSKSGKKGLLPPNGTGREEVDINKMEAGEVKRQLLLERSNYEKLMIQLFALTNDLNEREEAISGYKRRMAKLEQTLSANEKLHEQDAMIRLQLGKRLEQVCW